MEHLSNLLQEALPVKLGGRCKCILTQQDVLALKSCVKVVRQQVQRLFFSSVQNYFDCVLQIDAHFVRIQILLSFLTESLFRLAVFTFQAKDRSDV